MATDDKRRRANWTREEEVILVEEVNKRESLLFGKLDGCQRTNTKKIQAWEDISSIVNSNSKSDVRDVAELKKKYQNFKQKAKAKRSAVLRPPTGGGPRPKSPTTPENLMLQNLEGRPSLCGVTGGIDTDIPMATSPQEAIPQEAIPQEAAEAENMDDMGSAQSLLATLDTQMLDSLFPQQKHKCKPKIEDLILKEELEKIKENRVLIQEQITLARLQQQLIFIQIENAKKSVE